MNILVIGTGAIGGFYGSLLARAGAQVSVVARSDYDAIVANGIHVQSRELGDYRFRPTAVLRHAHEAQPKPDYVLLCTKQIPGMNPAVLLQDALGPATAIVLIANGIDVEQPIAAAFPNHELISGLAFVCVARTAPGRIDHQDYGRLVLGTYPRGTSARVETLCAAFKQSGIPCVASADIVTSRWEKCLWNAAFNPLSVLSGGQTTDRILATQEPLIRAIMAEVATAAQALGPPLPADAIDTRIASTRTMTPYKTSMLLDFEAGRPLETEAILGATIRAARRVGVSTPHLDCLYALLQLREMKGSA